MRVVSKSPKTPSVGQYRFSNWPLALLALAGLFLTVRVAAAQLPNDQTVTLPLPAITPHWVYDRIHNGTIEVARDPETNLYMFPDKPNTIALFKLLRTGKIQNLRF